MSNSPQHYLGSRERSNWGIGSALAEYVVGDIIYIPEGSAAILDGRVTHAGLWRVESCFSIGEDASFYYRVCPVEIVDGRRLRTDWGCASDRLHVIPGNCDYTAAWVRLWEQPEREGKTG